MLHISEDYFHQGLRQVAFFHGIHAEDTRYDIEKDVVEGKLVPIGGGVDEVMERLPHPAMNRSHLSRNYLNRFKWIYPGPGMSA